LSRLELLHPSEIDLGLSRVLEVATRLQLLPLQGAVITVAGTNGKGSTVATMEAVLGQMGCLTGSCTSPHLLTFNERIRIGGQQASDDDIVGAFEQIDLSRKEVSLTYFEFATLAALLIFKQHKVEVALLEVGLGGRLDAVNIVDANVAVITSIDIDHQEWLGDTRELIALEKAGILRAGQSAIIADTDPPESLRQYIKEVACKPCYSGESYQLKEHCGRWSARLVCRDGSNRVIPEIATAAVLPQNICAALQALLLLGKDFSNDQLLAGLSDLQPGGRRELQVLAGKEYLLDVAHNVPAVDKMLEYIAITPCNGKTIALFSSMVDKDFEAMVGQCVGFFDAWFIADQPNNPRAVEAAAIAHLLHNQGCAMVSVSKNIRQALRRAQGIMSEGDRLVVFGSFYTVAEVLPLLEKNRSKGRS